jgi:hypothetical protein
VTLKNLRFAIRNENVMTPGKILLTTLLTLGSFIAVHGQYQSQYDRGTPPQLAAGVSSSGSYTSTELGTVNLSNGGLNFNLPLGTIGGRGNVSIPLVLSYSSKVWSATMDVDIERESGTEQSVHTPITIIGALSQGHQHPVGPCALEFLSLEIS